MTDFISRVLRQIYSWGRFQISEDAFKDLKDSLGLSRIFFEIFGAFGVKTSEDERRVYGVRACSTHPTCSANLHGTVLGQELKSCRSLMVTEISYAIVYVEKHERNLKDPWSVRQFGVYHQVATTGERSRWILLDLRNRSETRVKELFTEESNISHMALHVKILMSLASNWIEYVDYLSAEWRDHVS